MATVGRGAPMKVNKSAALRPVKANGSTLGALVLVRANGSTPRLSVSARVNGSMLGPLVPAESMVPKMLEHHRARGRLMGAMSKESGRATEVPETSTNH